MIYKQLAVNLFCVFAVVINILLLERDRVTYPGLLEHLKDVSNWDTVGAHLLPADDMGALDIIRRSYKGDVDECKKALFRKYMEVGDCSWKTVVTALKKSGYKNIAKDIARSLGL